MNNSVTLYSNGIGNFKFHYDLKQPEGSKLKEAIISIPMPKAHLSDGINLSITGDDVKVIESPSYNTVKETKINLDPEQTTISVFKAFRGASLNVKQNNNAIIGLIVGCEFVDQRTAEGIIKKPILSLQTKEGIRRINVDNIDSYEFEQQEIKEIFARAMENCYSKIHTESSVVSMKVQSEKGDKVGVEFLLPVACWGMQYRLKKTDKGWQLAGDAIVHNNTDSAWKECDLQCIVGNYYTQQTNITDQYVPQRNSVNVFPVVAEGGNPPPRRAMANSMRSVACAAPMPYESVADDGGASFGTRESNEEKSVRPAVFKAKNLITVPPNSSATIEMFVEDIRARDELYYNSISDAVKGQPQMALRFVNTTKNSLQYGPCNIFDEIFVGSAMLPNTVEGEERLLLHGRDAAIEITREDGGQEDIVLKCEIGKGTLATETMKRIEYVYTVKNYKNVDCSLVIDHVRSLKDVKSEPKPEEITSNSVRYRLEMRANKSCTLKLSEHEMVKTEVKFDAMQLKWVAKNCPDFTDMKKAIEIQAEISTLEEAVKELQTSNDVLIKHQAEYRKNIEALKNNDELSREMQKNLKSADDKITKNRADIDSYSKDLKIKKSELQKALKELKTVWKNTKV